MSKWLDFANISNKIGQSYFNGFIDISGGGIHLRNDNPLNIYNTNNYDIPDFRITSKQMTIFDGSSQYYDVSNTALIYIRDLSANVQSQLNTLVNQTKNIQSDSSNAWTLLQLDASNSNARIYGNLSVSKQVGIGIQNPAAPLDVVAGNAFQNIGTETYFTYNNTSGTAATNSTHPYSIISRGSMLVSGNLVLTNAVTFSDSRMKTHIQSIDNTVALNTIRQLQPKQFQYKDTFFHGNNVQHGFVAQDIESVFSNAVQKIKKYIPNIYEIANISGDVVTLVHAKTEQITVNHSLPTILKMYDPENREIIVPIHSILNDKQIRLVHPLRETSLFVYGQEIDDFLAIDKDAIFTLSVSALQHIDTELQETKQKMNQLESKVKTQQLQIDSILQKIGMTRTMSF
jgi:hypothetical protein